MKTPRPTGKAAAANDDSTLPAEAPQRIKTLDAALIDLLKEYKARHDISNDALGRRLGFQGTYVSRAFNGQFTGDAEAFQAAAKQLLEDEANARRATGELLETGFLVEPMREFLSTVRVSKSIGVTWCAPGKGKTKGIEIYRRSDPTCIVVTASKELCGWRALRDAVLAAIPGKRRLGAESWSAWMLRVLGGSGRLLIIDNAHLLTTGARHWVAYDWHDAEKIGCPVALVGNEEIISEWRRNDQHRSRIGVAYELRSKQQATDTARAMLALYLPGAESDDETLGMAREVLRSGGACRALEKHALIAADLLRSQPGKYTPASALRAANALLLTDVKLAA